MVRGSCIKTWPRCRLKFSRWLSENSLKKDHILHVERHRRWRNEKTLKLRSVNVVMKNCWRRYFVNPWRKNVSKSKKLNKTLRRIIIFDYWEKLNYEKTDEDLRIDSTGKIDDVCQTNTTNKFGSKQKLIWKDVKKQKKVKTSGQVFWQNEEELGEWNQTIETHEKLFGAKKFEKDALSTYPCGRTYELIYTVLETGCSFIYKVCCLCKILVHKNHLLLNY